MREISNLIKDVVRMTLIFNSTYKKYQSRIFIFRICLLSNVGYYNTQTYLTYREWRYEKQ